MPTLALVVLAYPAGAGLVSYEVEVRLPDDLTAAEAVRALRGAADALEARHDGTTDHPTDLTTTPTLEEHPHARRP